MTSKSNSRFYEPSIDYDNYLKKAQYHTNSDCLTGEKQTPHENRSYYDKLLKSIEKKALKDQYGSNVSSAVQSSNTKYNNGYSAKKTPINNGKRIVTFHDSNKKINYNGDGEDGLKSKRHADLL